MMWDFYSYRIWYYSNLVIANNQRTALIDLYDNSSNRVGRIFFWLDETNIPANTIANGIPEIHFGKSQFNDVVTILRYEKPLRISDLGKGGMAYIRTKDVEPVGEQE